MKNQKALLRRRCTFFGVVIALLVLIAALAISLSAKSPEAPEQEEVSATPLKTVQPVFSAQTSSSAREIIPLESAVPSPESEIESLGEFVLTAYCPCVQCCGEWSAEHPSRVGTDYIQKTASGTIPTAGRTVSVDPSVIPFGTTVIISGHEYVAEDRGGAIKGNKIDIFFDDHDEALEFGRQTAEVFIVNNKED